MKISLVGVPSARCSHVLRNFELTGDADGNCSLAGAAISNSNFSLKPRPAVVRDWSIPNIAPVSRSSQVG